MASSYTGLGTELMTTGENAGTWGTTTNTNLQIIEQIAGGYVEQSVTSTPTTLSVSDGSTGATLAHRIIKFTGTISANTTVTVPLDVQQMYVLVNGTAGAYTLTFKYVSGSGDTVTWAATDKGTKLVYAAADHATNPNMVDSGIGSTAGHDLDGNELILDADADTSITADTDDQIDIKIAGADDFQFTANTFTAQSGSTIAAQALTATTVTASGIVKTDDTTEATSTTDGSLQTDGGLSVAKDAVIGDDLKLLSDSAVLSFGADSDTTLTHTDGTGLTLNSTNKFLFRDSALYINSSTDGQLDIVADTEVQIAATTIDINGAVALNGAITGATNITLSGELDAATLDISGDADIDGTLETDALSINSTTITTTAAEINLIDGGTARGTTAVADGDGLLVNDDGTMRMTNVTTLKTYFQTGVSVAADDISTGDGAVTIATSTGNITIDAQGNDTDIIFKGTDGSSDTTFLTIDGSAAGAATFNDKVIATELDISGNMDIDGTSNLDAVDIDGAVQIDNTVTVGVDDTGYDVKFFGATSGAYMLWDESTDDLILAGAAKLYLYDAGGGEYLSSSGSALTIASGGTAWELPTSDGSANQLLKTDGSGNLDWTTVSGTITALNNQSANRLTTIGSTTTELDGEANLTFTGSALTCIGTVTVGVDDTGHDVKFFGATSGKYLEWDESADQLDVTGSLDVTGNTSMVGTLSVGVDDTGHDVKFFGDTASRYWLWDTSADGVVQRGTLTVGVDDTGHDVKFFGATASAYMEWDESEDDLILGGAARIVVPEGQLVLGSTAVSSTAAELNLLDGVSGLVQADFTKLAAVNSTDSELNLLDGSAKSTSSITLADSDAIIVIDGNTTKQIPVSDIKTYNPGGTSWQAVITGNTTMVSGRGYFVNTTSAAITMTLPASPSIGDSVTVIDYAGTFDSNNCTVGRNSEKIHGASEDLTVATERAAFTLVFTDSTQGWLLTNN